MALKVGDLYVSLAANVSQFSKSMAEAAEDIAKFARKAKALANEVANIGKPMAVGLAAAFAIAAKSNTDVAREFEKSKATIAALANEIASMFLPVLREVNDRISGVVAWFQQLDPATKDQIVSWGRLALEITGASLAISKVAGAVSAVAEIGAMLGPVLVPIIAIAAGIAGIILIIGALRTAWDHDVLGMRTAWTKLMNWLGISTNSWKDFFRTSLVSVLQFFAAAAKGIVDAWAKVNEAFGRTDAAKEAREFGQTIESWAVGLSSKDGWKALTDDATETFGKVSDIAKQTGQDIKDAFMKGLETLGLTPALLAKIKAMLPDFSGHANIAPLGGKDAKPNAVMRFGDDEVDPIESKFAGWLKTQEEHRVAIAKATDELRDFVADGLESVIGKLGAFGQVLSSSMKAAKKAYETSGGDIGMTAVAGAVGALVEFIGMAFDFWGKILEGGKKLSTIGGKLGEVFQVLADGYDLVWGNIADFASLLVYYSREVLAIMKPSLERSGEAMKLLEPIAVLLFEAVEQTLLAVAKLGAIGGDLGPMMMDAAKGLFDAIKFVSIGFLQVTKGILDVWNTVLQSAGDLLNSVGLGDAAKALWGQKKDTSGFAAAISVLTGLTYDQAQATADSITATQDATAAAEAMTAAFLNVPEGYKLLTQRRFEASGADQQLQQIAVVDDAAKNVYSGNGTHVTIEQVNVTSNDPEKLWKGLRRIFENNGVRQHGYATTSPILPTI